MKREIEFTINGKHRKIIVKPNDLLLNVIREDLGLTGPKYGCGVGECGACSVLVDGEPILSCLKLAVTVDGKEIVTAEGIAGDKLHPVQEAFLEYGAIQCGFCTPAMVVTAKALLDENPNPTEEEIREYMKGVLCRCTGYTNIVKAIKACVEKLRAKRGL